MNLFSPGKSLTSDSSFPSLAESSPLISEDAQDSFILEELRLLYRCSNLGLMATGLLVGLWSVRLFPAPVVPCGTAVFTVSGCRGQHLPNPSRRQRHALLLPRVLGVFPEGASGKQGYRLYSANLGVFQVTNAHLYLYVLLSVPRGV